VPDEDALPLPPEREPNDLPNLEEETLSAWRLHRDPDALAVRLYEEGRFRSDAPAVQYPTVYANADRLGAFAEVYGDVGRIGRSEGSGRLLSRVYSTEPLSLVTLDRGETQKALGLDARICVSRRYGTTREWAYAIHRWYPQASGIRYLSRHASPHTNYCLFLDRCRHLLAAELQGQLDELRATVLLAAVRYRLRSHIVWR
jgi:hypothetical protein